MDFGKIFIILGIILIGIGGLIWLGVPIGKLPGDIHTKGENYDFYFPITTSIILSIVLTAIFWFFRR